MENSKNLELIKQLFDQVYNKDNLDLLDDLFSSNLKLIDPFLPNFNGGLREYKERQTMFSLAFPRKTVKIDDIFSADNNVVVRWTFSGVQSGELLGLPPTNEQVNITGITIYRFENGKVKEIFQQCDRLGLLQQIGLIEPQNLMSSF